MEKKKSWILTGLLSWEQRERLTFVNTNFLNHSRSQGHALPADRSMKVKTLRFEETMAEAEGHSVCQDPSEYSHPLI